MRYYQGSSITQSITSKVISALGERAFILGGRTALQALQKHQLFQGLNENGVNYTVEEFGKNQVWGKECCDEEVDRLTKVAKDNNCDVVLSAGGGKAIDTGKSVCNNMKLPLS